VKTKHLAKTREIHPLYNTISTKQKNLNIISLYTNKLFKYKKMIKFRDKYFSFKKHILDYWLNNTQRILDHSPQHYAAVL